MAIVTGDRYLDSLVKFVENHAESLIEGTLVLKLNPVGLRYVQSRLEALAELESLLAGAPVDYLRAYVSDLGDHRALEQLRRILRLLPSLKLVSVLPVGRDPTPLYLLPFGRLKVLELRGCDLSTSAAKGLLELRFTLEKLICHDSTDALRHVFASRIADIRDSHQWNRLSFVSCACNGLVLMDESLLLLPAVETLDLSRNKFATVDNLRKCTKLKHVDLGFNNLRNISSFNEVSCQIVKLVLRNNALTSLRGIEKLKSLQGLDLSYNIISNFSELEILAGFLSLQSLWLEGNPICCARWFRPQVFSLFPRPDQLELDEKKISTSEFWQRQIIIASRQKQPASFGFYMRVQDDADVTGNTNTKRKRISRLVNIEDNEHSPCTCSDQDTLSCDNQSQNRDENINTEQEAEIEDLVTRIEFLKKDRSVLWLQEFKEWMNQTFENSVDRNKFRSTILDTSNDIHFSSKTKDGDLAETSNHISDSFKLSGDDDSSTPFLESGTSFADTSTGVSSQRFIDQLGESASRSFVGQYEGDNILSKPWKLNHDELNLISNEGSMSVDPGDFNAHFGHGILIAENMNSSPSVLNDAPVSCSLSAWPGSPPHYQEDILQRRHNLEEEFLQLSAESLSVASSESYTSCSEDDSGVVSSSAAHVDQSGIDHSSERSHNSFPVSYHVDVGKSYVDSISASMSNGTNTVGYSAEGKYVTADEGCIKWKDELLEKEKHRRKPRKRMISLPEEEDVHCYTNSSKKSADHIDPNRCDTLHGDQEGSCSSSEGWKSPQAGEDDLIVNYFNSNMSLSGTDETCRKYVQCNCLVGEGSECNEREAAILLSSEDKLHIIHVGACDGSETGLKLVGCHWLGDLKHIFVGLGLQVLRLCFEGNASYLLITRCMERSRELLSLLNIFDSSRMNNTCSLTSLEQIQFNCFVEHVCGGSAVNLFQYSMVLFCPNKFQENLWLPRSLFVLERHLLICTENLLQFGPSKIFDPEYFSLDSSCAIVNVSKMVIETQATPCVTLILKHTSKWHHPSQTIQGSVPHKKTNRKLILWKLKWRSMDKVLNFVALMKALHSKATSVPLKIEQHSYHTS